MLDERKNFSFLSKSHVSAMGVLKMRLNNIKKESFYNVNYILFVDCKKHNSNMVELFESAHDPNQH